ncbi:ABC transporter ATP-binding protein [Oceanobacillus alkalisoli]|uniref:ABC transporter ATP-binding protein n=1 Tax=Oceanobacillus alkalisoli TaxID=2925113 RepID=UPI001EF13F04|nr:ABC transporter ATP-binding protein [Oceanobacillus alkalisoli]MCF3943153.1 ABC transporter ATP-binding protein [Oceanobacillus alkalisoli]MCG5104731.1 ABC transporter ATP-binding protein [Oceanobacillus alkalisoli]
MSKPIIAVNNLVKTFGLGDVKFQAIKNLNFTINRNDFIVMVGPSGSGKSTLLNILSGLEVADEGNVRYEETDINHLSSANRTKFRKNNIGYVFQKYLLLSNLTAAENIAVGVNNKEDLDKIPDLLERFGLEEHQHKLPSELSGGQQQRVSILRALIKKPKVLICDEPTGALDQHSSKEVLKVIQQFHEETDMTIIMVTHDNKIPLIGNRIIEIKDGEIKNVIEQQPKKVKEIDW